MKYLTTILLSACYLFCQAQFHYKADIPVVKESGYYHLLISPEVSAVSDNFFSDIRIKNNSGNEIPYLLRTEDARKQESFFEYYQLKENRFIQKDSITRIVVENDKKENINRFCIFISNSDIRKYILLKGSNDGKEWYIVKQKTSAPMAVKINDNTEMIVFDFPEGNYAYYDISISNPANLPLLIHQVGKYKYNEILGKYTEVTLGEYARKDSTDKKTYISFPDLKMNYRINKLAFRIDDKRDFYRNAWFLEKDKYYSTTGFILSSQNENVIEVNDLKLNNRTLIVIDNKDNPPLSRIDIKSFQLNRYFCVYLDKDVNYTLFCGDDQLNAPQYDITYFQKNIPDNLPLLELKNFEDISVQPVNFQEKAFYETSLFLWLVIIIVGLFLTWICWKMIRKI